MAAKDRATLLGEQDDLMREARQLKGEIQSAGKVYAALGDVLASQRPEYIRFAGAPAEFEDVMPANYPPPINWSDVVDLPTVMVKVQALRSRIRRLGVIAAELSVT